MSDVGPNRPKARSSWPSWVALLGVTMIVGPLIADVAAGLTDTQLMAVMLPGLLTALAGVACAADTHRA